MKTENPPTAPISQEKSRPHSPELNLDPAWLFMAEQQTTFSIVENDGLVSETLRLPNGSYVQCPRKGGGCSIVQRTCHKEYAGAVARVTGISVADARARLRRLEMPNRPDGFHLWN